MPVFNVRHVDGRDRRVIAESRGQHVADCVVDAGFHQCCADTVRGRTINLAFYNRWIDDGATIVHSNIVEDAWNKSIRLNLDDRDVKLRGVSEREIAVLLL